LSNKILVFDLFQKLIVIGESSLNGFDDGALLAITEVENFVKIDLLERNISVFTIFWEELSLSV